jgi:hypothetical protein
VGARGRSWRAVWLSRNQCNGSYCITCGTSRVLARVFPWRLNADGQLEPSFQLATSSILTLEREKGFEPSTSTLARSHSTAELLPQRAGIFSLRSIECQADLGWRWSASAKRPGFCRVVYRSCVTWQLGARIQLGAFDVHDA